MSVDSGTISPQGIADVKVIDILRMEAVGGVGLDIDLEDLVELVEKIDKG